MTEAAPPTPVTPARSDVRILQVSGRGKLTELGDVPVRGGFGSDLARHPREEGIFYLLADRGPNFDTGKPFQKGFALPSFAPAIARCRVEHDFLVVESVVEIRGRSGRRLSGLPNPPGAGGTGETPVTWDGRLLPLDRDGIDPEGLVALPDGSFWIADEYGPHLLHVAADGQTIARLNPFGGGRRRLPRVLARRRPNRGLEGLTLTPDQRRLASIMQSPLENPTREVGAQSRISRILICDIGSGATRQFVYPQEEVDLSNSAICAVSDSVFLVIEHDALMPGDHRRPSWIKRIYRVDLAGATDVSDPADGEDGLLVEGRTLEEHSPDELRALGIEPVSKELVVDLLALDYPHDKPEGLAFFDDRTIAVLNDDDFGITSAVGAGRGVVPKVLPLTGAVSASELWLIPLPRTGEAGPTVR